MWKRPISKAVSPQTLQQCPVTLILQPPPNPKPPRKNYKTPKARRTVMEAAGFDCDGREFKNAQEMWREQIGEADEGENHKKTQWYSEGVAYWEGVEASVDGVLGGFGQVNEADIKGSEVFLNTLLHERFDGGGRNQHLVALDCGSGIGRITKNLLIRYFNEEFTPDAGSGALVISQMMTLSHFLREQRDHSGGFAYMCLPCDFQLDVKCATSPIPPKNEGQKLKEMEKVFKLCPFNQNHKLDFFNRRSNLKDLAVECNACKLPILGPGF
ncbi:Alpha-N-methyltransferase NTM1 - like 1 [Theobroma cacao]|nr:Alpha-N-methyltransferase NTM1 - like 1 [Theobroma cacao]